MKNLYTYSFCDFFVERLVQYVEDRYLNERRDFSRLAIVFGGRRPALFVNRALVGIIKGSFFPPRFFTIDEFVRCIITKHQSFESVRDLDNCYLLYELAQTHTPDILVGRETFGRFLPWIREILSFIDQLDLENIDSKSLKNIEANADIGYDVPEDINVLLSHIVCLRQAYHQRLMEQKCFSRGLQYACGAELVSSTSFDEFDQILFCNFFYFNRSEEVIVKDLYVRGKATLFFQGDQRRWPVLNRMAKSLDCVIQEGETPDLTTFDLKLYAGFDGHAQVGLVREILKKIPSQEYDQTVIVVPNAENIVLLLSEIAKFVTQFNISLGYPLKRGSVYSLFKFVFQSQLSQKSQQYYTKDYLNVLRHPFVKNLQVSRNAVVTRILVHKIEEILQGKEKTAISGRLFIDLKEVEDLEELYLLSEDVLIKMGIEMKREELRLILKEVHQCFFRDWEYVNNFKTFATVLEGFLDVLVYKTFLKNYPLNINIVECLYAIKEEFEQALCGQEVFEKAEIFKIFDSKINRAMVPFKGSPLKGLQVLGLFETRSLNFKNVIVLDANEGVLPKLSIYEPLIPREVMISLSLDRMELEEEIQRYQFMRLISSAQNVHLVYQQSKDKERSRFIEELLWEEQKKAGHLDVLEPVRAGFEVQVIAKKKVIPKTPEVIAFLKNHCYSASSLNTYLRNPLEFYETYVLGLRQEDNLLDEPQARHLGTFVHGLLEEAFAPFLNKRPDINAAFRNRFNKLFEQRFEDTFGRGLKSDALLLHKVLEDRMGRFLDQEAQSLDRKIERILHLEARFQDVIELSCGSIKFSYIVDRIDQMLNGEILIVDYKTGSIDQMPKAIGQIQTMTLTRESISEHVKSFQVPLYFQYFHRKYANQTINAALYNLRTLKLQKFIDKKTTTTPEQINQAFLRPLDFIMTEILNPEVDFVEGEGY